MELPYASYVAVIILVISYSLIISNRVQRSTAALFGAILMVITGIVSETDVLGYVQWEVIALIFGMFVIVDALRHAGFFDWMVHYIERLSRGKPLHLFLLFSVLSAVLAAFMDSVTVLIFMASLTITACKKFNLNPVPFIIGEILSANCGGAATMVGDPPNVIIGTALGYSFVDVVLIMAPIAIVAFAVNLVLMRYAFRKELRGQGDISPPSAAPHEDVKDWRLLWISLCIFVFTVTLLVLHSTLNITIAMVGISGACLVLLLGGPKTQEVVQQLDWRTLLFFVGLFVIVGGVESTGVLTALGEAIGTAGGGNLMLTLTILLWTTALLSMLVDNIPYAMAMVPVIRALSLTHGYPTDDVARTVMIGCDVGGNALPIGASANIVGLAVAEKHGIHVSWKDFCKIALPATLVVVAAVNVIILVYVAI
jgi:Na+/H+ antiporter NhaD/arsenite permease-like protein